MCDSARGSPRSWLLPNTIDPEQFHGRSALGFVKILRCAQDDSVTSCPRVHAGALFYGVVPGRGCFRHESPVFYGACLKGTGAGMGQFSPVVQNDRSEDKDLRRCGKNHKSWFYVEPKLILSVWDEKRYASPVVLICWFAFSRFTSGGGKSLKVCFSTYFSFS